MDNSDGVDGKKYSKQDDKTKMHKYRLDCINLRRCS